MILGIDAFNLSSGGGITHLIELLRAADPARYGFERVLLWGGDSTLAKVEEREWLEKVHDPLLDRGLFFRASWHLRRQKELAREAGCDVVFLPGGTDFSGFKPSVTMSRNMLPFEWPEIRRYGWSLATLKFLVLRRVQQLSFRRASGLIFLTNYARNAVVTVMGGGVTDSVIIPHGISERFFRLPRTSRENFTFERPCRIVYVSIVSPYKHQWTVVDAVSHLRKEGVPVELELVGPSAEGFGLLQEAMKRADPEGEFIHYHGAVPYGELEKHYANADIGLFASSCENMPNILLEGMAAGLPMVSSNMGPMPEILGEAGEYFDPLSCESIANALKKLVTSAILRDRLAKSAFQRAKQYSWQHCANLTFEYLAQVANKKQ